MTDESDAAEPSPPSFDGLPPKTMLGDTYEIEQQIALGGMAEVYRARNVHNDELVAIKVVLPEVARDTTNLALFKRESQVLSKLHNDAIVRYLSYAVDKELNRPYLVMEFVDGVRLGEFTEKTPLDAPRLRALVTRIALGLDAAHNLSVIHRDLSPSNIILPDRDVTRAKIIDFGIAKAQNIGDGRTLLDGKFAGTYLFVSPEQLGLAGGQVTRSSDIYSLGLVAAAAMLGKPLDMSGSQADVVDKRRRVPDLTGIDPAIRPALERMLAPLPSDRPRDMQEVISLLDMTSTDTVRSSPPRPSWDGTTVLRDMPLAPTSQAPASWRPSQPPTARDLPPVPPYGSSPLGAPPPGSISPMAPFSVPAGAGSQPPVGNPMGPSSPLSGRASESPFRQPSASPPPTYPSTPSTRFGKSVQPRKKSGGGAIVAAVVVGLLAAAGGAAYLLRDSFLPLVEPEIAQQQIDETDEGKDKETVTPPPPAEPPLGALPAQLAWLRSYQLGACRFAAPIGAAESFVEIEAFGQSEAPFVQLGTAFEREFGIDPDIQLRMIDPAQCAVADFMAAVSARSAVGGPTLDLQSTNVAYDGSLTGNLARLDGWITDLFLVSSRGSVQSFTSFLERTGSSGSFTLDNLRYNSAAPTPMLVVAISHKEPLTTTQLATVHEAKRIFPVILQEITDQQGEVSVTVGYFKLAAAP